MIERATKLQKEIQDKWEALDKIRELNGSEAVLLAIRKKIYLQQDELIELIAKHDIELTGDILIPKRKSLHFSRTMKPLA